MAYNYNPSPDEGIMSKFNAGILQTNRIGDLQKELNIANSNLLAFNSELGIYNYEWKLRTCENLFQEVKPKLSNKEKIAGTVFIKGLKETLREFPIYKENMINHSRKTFFHQEFWKHIEDALFRCEGMVRAFLEAHKMNSPPEDESALF